jgi:hypothetical protein
MYRFVSLDFFVLRKLPDAALRLRFPPPRNFCTKFCVEAVTCRDTISSALTSGDLFSAVSVKMLPAARRASYPTALPALQSMGLMNLKRPPKKLPIPWPR